MCPRDTCLSPSQAHFPLPLSFRDRFRNPNSTGKNGVFRRILGSRARFAVFFYRGRFRLLPPYEPEPNDYSISPDRADSESVLRNTVYYPLVIQEYRTYSPFKNNTGIQPKYSSSRSDAKRGVFTLIKRHFSDIFSSGQRTPAARRESGGRSNFLHAAKPKGSGRKHSAGATQKALYRNTEM